MMSFELPIMILTLAFIVQVTVMSFYTPYRIRHYFLALVEKFPQEEYPRLYPVSPEEFNRQQRILQRANTAIGIIGLLAFLLSLLLWREDQVNSPFRDLNPYFMIASYCVIQMFPMLVYARWQRQAAKRMREMEAPKRRSAELRRLKITDYVSPAHITFGLAANALNLGFAAYCLVTGTGPRNLMIYGILSSGFLLLMMLRPTLKTPQFKRIDPFLSPDDLFAQRRIQMSVLFRTSGIYALFVLFIATSKAEVIGVDIDIAYGFTLLCLLLTVSSMRLGQFYSLTLQKTDFSVYRVSQ